jgi:cobalamin-dependent methionine synthase I
MTARSVGCEVVLGGADFIADPTLIRRMYDAPWSEWEAIVRPQLAMAQAGPHRWVSLYARVRGIPERELLQRLVRLAGAYPDVEVLLHHFDTHAAGPALAAFPGRALLSYVSGEAWMLQPLKELLTVHRPRIVVQPVDDGGIPHMARHRIDILEHVWGEVAPFGLARSDIFVDVLSPAVSVLPFAASVSVDTAALARERGFSTIAWPGNVGLGHPRRDGLAAAFAAQLVHAGLDLAVVAGSDSAVLDAIAAANQLRGFAPHRMAAAEVNTAPSALVPVA